MGKNKLYQYIMTFFVCLGILLSGYIVSRFDIKKEVGDMNDTIDLQGIAFTSEKAENFNELIVLKSLEEELNLNITFTQINSKDREVQGRYIAQMKEMPDFIMGGDFNNSTISNYINQDMIIPLDELIAQYAPHIQTLFEEEPIIKQYCTYTDGKIYTLPFYNENKADSIENYLFINRTWLEKLGLGIPTTTEEFYTVLKAFKERDPNQNGKQDEIPFSYIESIPKYSLNSFVGAFGIVNSSNYLMVQEGKVHFVPEEEGYKESIVYLGKLYREGLIDAEVFTHNLKSYIAKGSSEEPILGAFIAKDCGTIVGEERARNDYIAIAPLKGPKGNQLWGHPKGPIKGNQFMILATNNHPEETMAWIDQFFNQDNTLLLQWGIEGVTYNKVGDDYQAIRPPDGKSYVQFRFENSVAFAGPGVVMEETLKQYSTFPTEKRKRSNYVLYEPYLMKEQLCLFAERIAQQQETQNIYNNIHKYVKEMKIRWISGERDINTGWKNYLEELQDMGVERYIDIYQDIYNHCKRATRHH